MDDPNPYTLRTYGHDELVGGRHGCRGSETLQDEPGERVEKDKEAGDADRSAHDLDQRQPVSHQGTSPATIPGAISKKTKLPTAALILVKTMSS